MTDHSDYDSSRSSSTVPDSGRSYVSDTSFSSSLRSFGGESTTTTAGGGAASGAGAGKPHKANHAAWEAMKRLRLETAGGVGLDHFRLLRRVGSGDIGNVYLCRLRRASAAEVPECMYAMKVVDREALAFRKKLERAETEKEILGMLDHPFLPTLYAQFDVSHYSCLVMEFCPGGDLHTVRQRQPGRRFSVSSTKFYAAEILLALEYLHMMGVVYRDLKPENVLVRDDGHIMLSDFDLSLKCDVMPRLMTPETATATTTAAERTPFCSGPSCSIHMKPVLTCFYGAANRGSGSEKDHKKKAKERRPIEPELVAEPVSARSRSFVGTHEYLAPEVISGLGHGSEVDWWTLGVFMYELLFGRTPFKGEDNEKTLINIIKQPLRFPRLDINGTSCRDMEELVKARDLISRLLVKNPKRRIGSLRGAVEIKRHEFFKGVNWALIRTVKPPEVPKESQRVRNKEPVGGVVAAQRHGKRERGASATYSIPQYFEYF